MRSSALVLMLVTALFAGSATLATAELVPIPRPPVSALGTGDTVAEACQDAAENLRDQCLLTGPITYSDARCFTVDPPGPLEPITLCHCVASTLICVNPFPF